MEGGWRPRPWSEERVGSNGFRLSCSEAMVERQTAIGSHPSTPPTGVKDAAQVLLRAMQPHALILTGVVLAALVTTAMQLVLAGTTVGVALVINMAVGFVVGLGASGSGDLHGGAFRCRLSDSAEVVGLHDYLIHELF